MYAAMTDSDAVREEGNARLAKWTLEKTKTRSRKAVTNADRPCTWVEQAKRATSGQGGKWGGRGRNDKKDDKKQVVRHEGKRETNRCQT